MKCRFDVSSFFFLDAIDAYGGFIMKQRCAKEAIKYIENKMVVGLGGERRRI